jgi:HD-like signal output (HDOD) protein
MSSPTPLLALRAQIDSLPALPAIVTKVLAITANPESSTDDLIRAILPDQSMCTAILKIANSALFGLPKRVSSMERAMVVLGQEEVKNIVIGKALFTAFPRMGKENRERLGLFGPMPSAAAWRQRSSPTTKASRAANFFLPD